MNKVAAIQMCSSDVLDDNLNLAAFLVEKAAKEGASLAVLPEMFVLFEKNPANKIKIRESMGEGKIQTFLANLAKMNGIWIVAGTIPLSCEDENKFNAASIVFDDKGREVARYDKIHLFDVTLSADEVYKESDSIVAGKDVVVIDSPIGRLGLCVCYDMRFIDLFIKLSQLGAEVIAVPAAFTVPTGQAHWQLLCRSRAIDTFCYVIGACQGGTHTSGRKTYGHSMIVDPWGEVIEEITEPGPGLAFATIDLKKIHAIRNQIPILEKRQGDPSLRFGTT